MQNANPKAVHVRMVARVGHAARPRAGQAALRALRIALVVAGLYGAQGAGAQAAVAGRLGVSGLLAQLYSDAACAEERVIGECFCASLPCGLRVERYVPVAFVETTRAPGDSLLQMLPLPAGLAGPTVSSSLSATDNTAEAHVWSLPGGPLPLVGCLTCTAASAASPELHVAAAATACGSDAAVVDATGSMAATLAGPWLPSLTYASELDTFNWRTGCRDRLLGSGASLASALRCAAPPAGAAPDDVPGCLGRWGALLPRQMRDIGPGPLLYSAKTAVRAMSIAREQLAVFSYPVDTGGKLQQSYPVVSACFRVGELPLPQLPAAARPVSVSPDGRYGWIYWRPTTCCVGFAAARQCLRLH